MDQQTFITVVDYTGVKSGQDIPSPVIPAAPTLLTATADSDSINLAWTNGDTYSTIRIDRKTNGDYTALASATGNATSYDDTTAVVGVTYTYKVKGVKATYPSPYSNEASDTIIVSSAHSANFDGIDGTDLTAVTPSPIYLTSDDTIIIGGWIKPSVHDIYALLLGKVDPVNYSYALASNGDGTIGFYCRVGTNSVREVDSPAIISNGTKYFILAWKNLSDTTINIQINANSPDSVDYHLSANSFTANTGDLFLGGETGGGDFYTGLLDEMFICLNPTDLSAALSLINTNIYNSGTGLKYSGLSSGNKTTMGLVSWWGLDETSGNRIDLHGSNNLTVQGNVTSGTAIVT